MATYIDSIKNGVTTVFDHHASFGSIRGSVLKSKKQQKRAGSDLVYAMRFQTVMEKKKQEILSWKTQNFSGMYKKKMTV